MIRLALIRHGHTAWNREGRIQGRTDIPLDEPARADLAQMCLPPDWEVAELWSSPLARAIETARLIAGRAPKTDQALMEMDWGKWEGKRAADLHADPHSDHRPIERWGWHYTPPNGESPDILRARLLPWMQGLNRDAVAVCHIGVMRVIMALATGWNFDSPPSFQVKRNRLFVIELDGPDMTLQKETPRLERRSP